ncbi:MAG: hypothetical protein KDC54_08100, partial [Lewinella sp.]|nr:hypothetical protein [Lewinella sp.]
GSTKSEGLRQALDTYLEREARDWQTHPYFWAHLCLAGQDQPVTLGHDFGWGQRALYGVTGLLMLSLGWWSWRRRR